MKAKKIAALMTALTMAVSTGCLDEDSSKDQKDSSSKNGKSQVSHSGSDDRPTELIMRKKRAEEKPMGEEGTWTVFVYMCGSDLESEDGAGTNDLEEMMDSSANENVRFVVQTGGAEEWDCEVDPDACERYVVQNGTADLVYSGDETDMGDGESLADFLKWGIAEYPAANMGLVFWDHGSGSINGVCFDENHDESSLLLKEIDAALYSVYDDMIEPFEFVGFDACLMATAETAAIMATHARYMVASEESEPGNGWNYEKIGSYLAKNPSCTGEEIGKYICDSFYKECEKLDMENEATLSVTDLSKMDAFIKAFDLYSKDIYELVESSSDYTAIARAVSDADNFGGNNKASGYTNMVDAKGLIEAGMDSSDNAKAAADALAEAVVYMKNGSDHPDACGLSMYYPLRVSGSQELGIFKDVALSPYYLGLVGKIAYGAANNDISGYDNSDILGSFSNNWSTDSYTFENGVYTYSVGDLSDWDFADSYTPGSSSIEFSKEPDFDSDGIYCFTLTDGSLDKTDYVEAAVYLLDDEDSDMIELGYSGDVYCDYETGEFSDGFDGCWFALDDEQYLAAYLQENCDGYDIYYSPILLNGDDTYLRFAYYYDKGDISIIDVWDGIDVSGSAARTGKELKKGDKITPVYYAYSLEDDEEYSFEGDEFKYKGKNCIGFIDLLDGEYMYSFIINDIYGDYYETDAVIFTVDGEDVLYEKLD